MEVPFEIIKGKPVKVKPFKSKKEKAILEFSLMVEDEMEVFRNVCKILKVPEDLPFELKLAWIYKLREISFGGDLDIGYTCKGCRRYMQSKIVLENLLEYPIWDKLSKELQNIPLIGNPGIQEIQKANLSDLERLTGQKVKSLSHGTSLLIAVKSKVPRLKKTIAAKCLCGCENPVEISSIRFCLKSLSDRNMTSMLKAYHALVGAGFTKKDVDSMYPYEREIHLIFLKERTDEILGKKKT